MPKTNLFYGPTFGGWVKQLFKVRLAEIDAPEKNQPYGQKSKQTLSNLIFDKYIKIIKSGTDRYKRTIGYVYFDETNINLEMVKLGMAWVYTRYSKDKNFSSAEGVAREQKVGLWSLQEDQIMPPWEWRKHK